MTQARLIKRNEAATQTKPAPSPAATSSPRTLVAEWVTQFQEAKPRNARATFAALFAEPQRG